MQKWEYLFVTADDIKGSLYPWLENGREISNWKEYQNIYEYCDKKGIEGWELVAAPYVQSPTSTTVRLIFKRPIE